MSGVRGQLPTLPLWEIHKLISNPLPPDGLECCQGGGVPQGSNPTTSPLRVRLVGGEREGRARCSGPLLPAPAGRLGCQRGRGTSQQDRPCGVGGTRLTVNFPGPGAGVCAPGGRVHLAPG